MNEENISNIFVVLVCTLAVCLASLIINMVVGLATRQEFRDNEKQIKELKAQVTLIQSVVCEDVVQ